MPYHFKKANTGDKMRLARDFERAKGTDGRTDTPSYRHASMHLKMKRTNCSSVGSTGGTADGRRQINDSAIMYRYLACHWCLSSSRQDSNFDFRLIWHSVVTNFLTGNAIYDGWGGAQTPIWNLQPSLFQTIWRRQCGTVDKRAQECKQNNHHTMYIVIVIYDFTCEEAKLQLVRGYVKVSIHYQILHSWALL